MSDEPYTPFEGQRSEPAKPILIERVWRVRHPRSGKILSCGMYQHPHGIEVRSGYQQETNLLRSQLVKSPDAASELAAEWKAVALGKGFEEETEVGGYAQGAGDGF